MSVIPTSEQAEKLAADSEAKTGEVVMLNLLKFKARADSAGGGTGEESYARYAALAIQKVTERGGHVMWMGQPDSTVIGDQAAGDWDAVVLVSYPNRKAFMDMVADPAYQKGHDDRVGGVERMALVAMTPGPGFTSADS